MASCSFVHEMAALRGSAAAALLQIDVFDMGRGVGGRASTRGSRDLPSLAVNHGAPYFDVHSAAVSSLAESFLAPSSSAAVLEEWQASKVMTGSFDASALSFSLGEEGSSAPPGVRYFSGAPGMGALSEALFGAGEAFTTLRPSTQIRRIERVPSAESTTTKGGGEGASWQWRLSAAPPKTKRGDTTVSLVNSVEDDCQIRPHCLTDLTDLTA